MIDNMDKAHEILRGIWNRQQQNEDVARVGKQQNCVKPHICFTRGRWQMDGWYEGNLPHIAYCHADWKTAREYFRSVLRCR